MPDGSYGPLEKVFGGETEAEKLERLETENEQLKKDVAMALEAVALVYETSGGGVE